MSVVEEPVWNIKTVTTAATTVIKSGPGVIKRVILPTPVATATVKVWDGVSAAGAVLLETVTVPASPVTPFSFELGVDFTTGCTLVTAVANMGVVVIYR
jgi:hypothetical protein